MIELLVLHLNGALLDLKGNVPEANRWGLLVHVSHVRPELSKKIRCLKDIMPAYSVSKFERVLLLTFASCAFIYFAVGISAEAVEAYNDSVVQVQNELARQAGAKNIISFAVHGFFYPVPLFNLLTFFILLALIWPGRYILSFALTLVYLGLLVVTVASRLDGRGLFGSENFFTDPWIELSVKTSHDDHIAAVVIAVLLIWQGSIIFRTILHNRKNILV